MWCPPWFPKMHVKVLWSNSEHATPEDLNKIQRSVFMYSMHCYEHFAGSISTAFKGLLLKDLLKHYYLCWKISFFYNAVKTLVSLGWPKSEVGEWSRYQPDLWYFSPYLVILCSCIWLPRIFFTLLLRLWSTILAGKFGAFFASIPLPIFAAIYCILFGIVGE